MANQVSLDQIIVDAKSSFMKLLEKTKALNWKYENAYGADDARADFFLIYSLLNLWLLIQFDSFLEVLDRRSTRVSRYIKFTEQNRRHFMLQYDTIIRASYCTMAMFEVEYFLNSLAERLDGIKTDRGYRKVTSIMKKSFKLTDQQFKILNVLALVRNSLHNNGYHMEKDFELVIKGKSYKFEKGKQVIFSGWDNLYIMFDELLDVLVLFIIESAKVKQLTNIPHSSMTYHDTQQDIICETPQPSNNNPSAGTAATQLKTTRQQTLPLKSTSSANTIEAGTLGFTTKKFIYNC